MSTDATRPMVGRESRASRDGTTTAEAVMLPADDPLGDAASSETVGMGAGVVPPAQAVNVAIRMRKTIQ